MTSCNRILNRISNPSTVASWNCHIRATVNEGRSQKALLLYCQMKRSGIEPDNLTFPFIAKACARLSDVRNSKIIHTHVAKSPFSSDIYVQTAMVDMYVKCQRLDFALDVFERMLVRDVAAWNAMIMGFSQSGLLDRVSFLFRRMRLAGFQPDSVTIISLTQLNSDTKNLNMARAVHCLGIQIGIEVDISVVNTWITAYSRCNDLDSAELVFNGIPVEVKTVVSWNSMLAGFSYLRKFVEVIDYFHKMCRDGIRPDLSTILTLLSSCANSEAPLEGKVIHSHGIKDGFDSDVSVTNTLISMYAKCGDVVSAHYLFSNLNERTRVSWTVMIGGYAQNGDIDEALDLLCAMESAGEKPDEVTMVSLLSGCSLTGALELGKWVNRYVIANRLEENIIVCNALVDMYAKCGSIIEARRLFDMAPGKTIVSWTTMISGYAMNGEFEEAFNLFSLMVESGLKPNHITFLAVLQACTHAGLLEKGWDYFDAMTRVYKIRPRLEHYACMADLLGRRGKVRQALEFVQNIPVKPDAGVWGALLGACRIHREVEVAEYVADRLFEIEPQTAVSYVVMANIYAAEGKWEGVKQIRSMMKCKGVRKSPGHSLIQVNGKVHAFTVEDRGHPEGLHIYEVLDSLALQLKEAGFEMDWRCIMVQELG